MLRISLLKETHNWIINNNLTPYLLINSKYKNCIIPNDKINEDGIVLLNISFNAVNNVEFISNFIHFHASFNSKILIIKVPTKNVLRLYSLETLQGFHMINDKVIFNESNINYFYDYSDKNKKNNFSLIK